MQVSVDRLGRAIEAAEDEMEATLRRTTDIHKSQLRQKELELHEQQGLLQVRFADSFFPKQSDSLTCSVSGVPS